MFIKRIGIVWFQGEKNINKPNFIENINNWKLLNPDWDVVILDNNMLREICRNYSEDCLKVYDSFDIMHLKIDFGRYVCLWETCGMYIDMDCYAFRSLNKSNIFSSFLNKINTHDHILGLSEVNTNILERFITKLKLNNAVMISSFHNPIIKDLIDSIIYSNKNYKNNKNKNLINSEYKIVHTIATTTITGPIMFNNFFSNIDMKKYKESIYIHTFPFYIFEPGQAFQNYDIKDDTIALHNYEMSWLSPTMKIITKQYYNTIKPYFLIFVIFILIIWLIYKYYYKNCKNRCESMCKLK
jgi:mannosyltransferase OCH1-like enzyme